MLNLLQRWCSHF